MMSCRALEQTRSTKIRRNSSAEAEKSKIVMMVHQNDSSSIVATAPARAAAAKCSWQPSGTMHPEAGHRMSACDAAMLDINIFLTDIHTRYTHTIIWFNSFILYCILVHYAKHRSTVLFVHPSIHTQKVGPSFYYYVLRGLRCTYYSSMNLPIRAPNKKARTRVLGIEYSRVGRARKKNMQQSWMMLHGHHPNARHLPPPGSM